jgi:hypothetical protein
MRREDRVADTHEVFTPKSLVRDMLDRLDPQVWFDPNKTWLEPAAGDGNFLVEIKARLLQAGHPERHVLNHQLFSIELMDDNHYVLQLRLGYVEEVDGFLVPGPALQDDLHRFVVSKINLLTQDLNHLSPYAGKTVLDAHGEPYVLQSDEVYHHVNHRCASALDGIDFPGAETVADLPILPEKELVWEDLYPNPEIGQPTIVSIYRDRGEWAYRGPKIDEDLPIPQTKEEVVAVLAVQKKVKKIKEEAVDKIEEDRATKNTKGGGWQVKAELIGKNMRITCKQPYDGSYWSCDHDLLVETINASLSNKGKSLIGQPGPSEKVYGSSSGLREPHLWSRVDGPSQATTRQ